MTYIFQSKEIQSTKVLLSWSFLSISFGPCSFKCLLIRHSMYLQCIWYAKAFRTFQMLPVGSYLIDCMVYINPLMKANTDGSCGGAMAQLLMPLIHQVLKLQGI
jgi:hypothetical protein